MKKHYFFFIGVVFCLISCTGSSNESSPQNMQEPQKEAALTDLQKVIKETCACIKEHQADQEKTEVFRCMMEIRMRYPNIDAMNEEEGKVEVNRQCPELAKQFKKAIGFQ
jgi:hypothetical protein